MHWSLSPAMASWACPKGLNPRGWHHQVSNYGDTRQAEFDHIIAMITVQMDRPTASTRKEDEYEENMLGEFLNGF